jgi:hypothetical protein
MVLLESMYFTYYGWSDIIAVVLLFIILELVKYNTLLQKGATVLD